MALTRNDEILHLWDCECDKCSYYDEIEAGDFPDAIRKMRNDDWEIKSDDGKNWIHLCPDCKAKAKEEPVSQVNHIGYGKYN